MLELVTEGKDTTKAVVVVIERNRKWLLGLSGSGSGDRKGTWSFVAGHLKTNETPKAAAKREAREEADLNVKIVSEPEELDKPGIAFVHAKTESSSQKFDFNHEFTNMGWFDYSELKSLKLYRNVRKAIDHYR